MTGLPGATREMAGGFLRRGLYLGGGWPRLAQGAHLSVCPVRVGARDPSAFTAVGEKPCTRLAGVCLRALLSFQSRCTPGTRAGRELGEHSLLAGVAGL